MEDKVNLHKIGFVSSPGSPFTVNRREFLRVAGLTTLGLFLTQCAPTTPTTQAPTTSAPATAPTAAPQTGGQLNIITWEGYDDPVAFKPFYDKSGVVPNTTYIGSNDEVLTKYKAGGAGSYDCGDINSRYIQPMVEQGMIIALDESKLPNLADIYPAFWDISFARQDGKLYAAPAFFGFDVITYNADEVPEPKTWDFYKEEPYKGKYGMIDNPAGQMLLWGMLVGVGADGTKWTQEDLEKVKALGMDVVKNAALIAKSYGEMKDLLVRGDINSVYYSWEAVAAWGQEEGANLQNTLPAGPAKAWADCYFIMNGAKNLDAAYGWVNHAISPEAMAVMGQRVSSLVANSKAVELMDPAHVEAMGYDGLNERIKQATFSVLPEKEATAPYITLDEFYKAYEEIKAGA